MIPSEPRRTTEKIIRKKKDKSNPRSKKRERLTDAKQKKIKKKIPTMKSGVGRCDACR